jgi:hypothetical protein
MRWRSWLMIVGGGLVACGAVPAPNEVVDAGMPDAPIGPPVCDAPASWPTTKSFVELREVASGHAGTDPRCATLGSSSPATNPQYVWCRRLGGEVRDSDGRFNHWWLWTDLDVGGDAGGRGWISAYFLLGQGNDQADDINTRQPIPSCP